LTFLLLRKDYCPDRSRYLNLLLPDLEALTIDSQQIPSRWKVIESISTITIDDTRTYPSCILTVYIHRISDCRSWKSGVGVMAIEGTIQIDLLSVSNPHDS